MDTSDLKEVMTKDEKEEQIPVTDENYDELYSQLASGQDVDETDEDNIVDETITEEVEETLPEEQTVETEIKQETPETEQQKQEEEETPETIREKARIAESKHKTIQGILEKQSRDLYEVRSQLSKVQPLLNVLQNDPVKAQQLFKVLTDSDQPVISSQDIDWTEPESIEKFVDAKTERKWAEIQKRQIAENQQQQTQRFVNDLAARMQLERTQKTTEGMSQEELTAAEKKLQTDYFGGKGVDIAVKYANYEKAIAEAEKRGAEQERKKIQKLGSNEPKRLSSVSSDKSNIVSKKISEMNKAELEEFTESPAFLHPNMDVIKQVHRRTAQVLKVTDTD